MKEVATSLPFQIWRYADEIDIIIVFIALAIIGLFHNFSRGEGVKSGECFSTGVEEERH